MRKYVIALYIRLSLEDAVTESLSIPNQRLLLRDHAGSLPEAVNAEVLEFVDNGYSGANFERPAVQELLELVRQNKIDCVIVKDFSRFGRNSLECGYFIEQVFPLFRTRFIAISNDFDTINFKGDTGGMEVAFQYLISEYYSRDLSVKSKTARYIRMRQGKYQSKICSYGYMKGASGRLEIDEEAAAVVRLIFDLASNGLNAAQIAKELYQRKIPTPGEYKVHKATTKAKPDISRTNGVWSNSTVLRILEDERYIGTYIMGKRTVTEVGSNRSRLKDESQWFKIPDHHPAIVGKDLFEQVRGQIFRFQIPKRKPRQYALKGKVFCGCCRHALFRIAETPQYFCRHSQVDESLVCHNLRIRESELEGMLFEVMEKQAQAILAIDSMEHLPELEERSTELVHLERQVDYLQECKRELYEQYLLQEIDLAEYKKQKARCDADLLHAKQLCGALASTMRKAQKEKAGQRQLLAAARNITGEGKLTQALVDLLIERVDVYPGNAVEISWKMRDFAAGVF